MAGKAFQQGGERKQITAVFIDLVGFSAIASTADAEDLQVWLDGYYRQSREIIEANDGEVTEYLGDGVVALFGLARADELAAAKAVDAAQKAVERISAAFMDGTPVKLRAGVATGEVAIRAGTALESMPRVTGMVTTLAQRIQERAEPGTVMISQTTRELLRGNVQVDDFPGERLKGFAEAQVLYRVAAQSLPGDDPRRPHFVGRSAELAEIAAEPLPCLIVGQAGIGKSALAAAIARGQAHHTVFQADAVNTGSSYQPFKDWIGRQCGAPSPDWTGICTRFALLGEQEKQCLALICGLPEGHRLLSELSNLALKARIEDSIRRAIAIVIPEGLLVFEDLHWFDAASFDVLKSVLGRTEPGRQRVLMTSREDVKIDRYFDDDSVRILSLGELSVAESGEMLDALGPAEIPPDLRNRLIGRAGGIPLFLEQLARAAPARGNTAIPETLMGLLAERIDATGAAKPVLQRASAIGRVFGLDMLKAIDPDAGDPVPMLRRGAETGVLEKRAGNEWAFSHALLQEAAYGSLLRSTRERLHARIAEVLQSNFPQIVARDPVLLAEHQSRARLTVPAIQSYLAASQWALLQGAFSDAETHARAALVLCGNAAAEPEVADLEIACHTRLGSILMQVRGYTAEPVRDAFDAVLRIARSQPVRGSHSAPALFGSFSHAIMSGDKPRADALCDLLAETARPAPDGTDNTETRLAMLAVRNCACFYEGDFAGQRGHIAAIRALYDRRRHAHMITQYGMDIFAAAQMFELAATAIQGDSARVVPLLNETDAHQIALDIPVMHPYALIWGAVSLFYSGARDRSLDRLRRGLRTAEEQGAAFWQITGKVWLHVIDPDALATAQGVATFGTLIDTLRGIGTNIGVPYFAAVHATALARLGRIDDACAASRAACDEDAASGLLCWHAEILRLHAGNCRRAGRREEAETTLRRALDVATGQNAGLWRLRAATDLAELTDLTGELGDAMKALPADADFPELRQARNRLEAT